MKMPIFHLSLYIAIPAFLLSASAAVTGNPILNYAGVAAIFSLLVTLAAAQVQLVRRESADKKEMEKTAGESKRLYDAIAGILPVLHLLEQEDRLILDLSGESQERQVPLPADSGDPLARILAYTVSFSVDRGENLRKVRTLQALVPLSRSLLEVQARIPYVKLLLERVVSHTERAAMTLLERFEAISEQADAGAKDAGEAISALNSQTDGINAGSLEHLISRSYESIINRGKVIQEFLSINQENTGRIRKISTLVDKTEELIVGIEDIAERSKLITFNLAVESAKIGVKGQGFKVIVTELQKLNNQTTDFAKNILQIVKEFNTYNAELLERWIGRSETLTEKVRSDTEQAERTVNALKESYELTRRLFASLSENAIRVNKSMGDILSSLQFQDITRQQIEGAGTFIEDIAVEVDSTLTNLKGSGYALATQPPSSRKLQEIYTPRLKVTTDHDIFDILSRRDT